MIDILQDLLEEMEFLEGKEIEIASKIYEIDPEHDEVKQYKDHPYFKWLTSGERYEEDEF